MPDDPNLEHRPDGSALRRARETGHVWLTRLVAPPSVDGERHTPAGPPAPAAGTEHPGAASSEIPLVERAFAFVDLCGFTKYTAEHGEHAAIAALRLFRSLTRDLAARRGVRVDKWLGDGAMIVGIDVAPTIATVVELLGRYDDQPLALRAGLAHGKVIILDGDDYVGRPVNLAARLCQSARPSEVLAVGYDRRALPPWVRVVGTRSIALRGLGRIAHVQQLAMLPDLELPALG